MKTDAQIAGTVQPSPPQNGLGANFDHAAPRPLVFATKSRIWGDHSGTAREPVEQAFTNSGLKKSTLYRDEFRCQFCGFRASTNEVHNLNDNHSDLHPENLQAVDPYCHGWQHLGEFAAADAAIAYLPGVSPTDFNHLQRTIAVALQSGDAETRDDARNLLNWLGSHREYAERAWGTCDPAVFADALVRQPFDERDFREIVFDGLGLVLHPCITAAAVADWLVEAYAGHPCAGWARVYHDIMIAPL